MLLTLSLYPSTTATAIWEAVCNSMINKKPISNIWWRE